ncbi:MAG: trigger factor [Micavibrio sp.]|nr:trigger factor [Micavibrio sp.]MBK9563336.1 trigger factor [Micavibrio sp.]
MQVKELKKSGLNHELEVTVTAQDIDKRVDQRLKEVGKTIKMPGFRPGKVPLKLLKQKYGKAIMGEVLEIAVNETSTKALQEKDLKPALQPKIEVKSFDEGKDLTYTMSIEVLPKFDVKEYKGLKLQKLVSKPDDKAVTEALEKIAANNHTTVKVEGKRAAKDGDTTVIHFKGRTADDNFEHPGMEGDDHHLKLGSGMFIPGFEEQLIGKKVGDKAEVKVTFPKNYSKDLAGRDAIFDVEIKELREPGEAKIDDDFAKSLGLDNLDALKTAVQDQMQQEYDRQSKMYLKKTLMDRLDELHDFEIPAGMHDMEFNNILGQIEHERAHHVHGENCDHGDDYSDKVTDKEKDELKDIAGRRVRLGLVLSEIGTKNNIKVSDIELQKAVIAEAQRYPGQERDVFDYFSKNRGALETLRAPLFEQKVVDYILELADVSEKTVSGEELLKALDEDEGEGKEKSKKPAAKKKKA